MTSLNNAMTKTDDLWINCYSAFAAAATLPSSFSDFYKTDLLLENLLYNLGYMFTDILDLIFYDPTNREPYWYYVAYRIGDFSIRFFYADKTDD
jgi:hypothetical protein